LLSIKGHSPNYLEAIDERCAFSAAGLLAFGILLFRDLEVVDFE